MNYSPDELEASALNDLISHCCQLWPKALQGKLLPGMHLFLDVQQVALQQSKTSFSLVTLPEGQYILAQGRLPRETFKDPKSHAF